MAYKNLTYKKAIDILTSQGKFYINLGLERMEKILELLEHPEKTLKFIHVAGTNGKGSVCAMLSAILRQERGKRKEEAILQSKISNPSTIHPFTNSTIQVGLFTSPHVFEYTERIKINDVEIDKEIFAQKIIEITELAQKNNIHLTEFEILTVLALDYFAQNKVDIVILETGLGGRLDATNVIEKNICSIITNIDFDHTERLGDTIEKISYEKAGIIKENCPVVISEKNAGFNVIKKNAEAKKSKIIKSHNTNVMLNLFKHRISERPCDPETSSGRREKNSLNSTLKGKHQQENLSLVLKAIEILNKKGFNISHEAIEAGLKNVKHPCRFEFLEKENILIDGAHNPNGTKALRESLEYHFPNQKFRFIFGCLNNKNYAQMMENLFRADDEIYFYQFNNPNACTYVQMAGVCSYSSKDFVNNKNDFKRNDNTLTVICGSFYMIKELLKLMPKASCQK